MERLALLPVRNGDDLWEVGLMRLPVPVHAHECGSPVPCSVAPCVSSRGVAAIADPFPSSELNPACLLAAIGSLANDHSGPNMPALGYLPSTIRVAALPDDPTDLVERMLPTLGVAVKRTSDLRHFVRAAESLAASLVRASGQVAPRPVPGLMSVRGMTVERVRGLAEAMAAFVAAAPWRMLAREVPWTISPQPTTKAMRTCAVTGILGEQVGLAFFASMQDHLVLQACGAMGVEAPRPRGTLWSVMLEPLCAAIQADLALWSSEHLPECAMPAPVRARASRGGTPSGRTSSRRPSGGSTPDATASAGRAADAALRASAIPLPIGFTESGRLLRPTPDQLLLMETLLRGFAACDPRALRANQIAVRVQTSAGLRELLLRR